MPKAFQQLRPIMRYPGGKGKIYPYIIERLMAKMSTECKVEYREPFLGGGNVAMNLMAHCPWVVQARLNDKDVGIANLWNAIMLCPDDLIEKVMGFEPSVDAFFDFKRDLLEGNWPTSDFVECGFKKLVVHQLSYSGLGTRAGSPIGGIDQDSQYPVGSRWNSVSIVDKIKGFHRILSRNGLVVSCLDFEFIIKPNESKSLIYLDPPYYGKGGDVYQCVFSERDHVRLSYSLKESPHDWLLSYDDCPEIRDLYSWAKLEVVEVGYSITGSRKKNELLITNPMRW